MTALRQSLRDYLELRRSLGYKLERTERLLVQFLRYLEVHQAEFVSTEHALAWARLPENGDSCWWSYRLSVVRGFARFLRSIDARTEVPPTDVLPWRPSRATPYLYSDADITALIDATSILRPPLRVATYRVLTSLLAVTGMRVGEAIGLDTTDFDADHGVVIVRSAKLGKSRELPLHPTTVAALRRYLRQRGDYRPPARSAAFFISPAGTRLRYCNVHWTFQRLVRHVELQRRSGSCRPRIHDLRHTFAVHSLLETYRQGLDPQHRLTLLSTYLGHSNPAATYWYLSAAPELLEIAAARLNNTREMTE